MTSRSWRVLGLGILLAVLVGMVGCQIPGSSPTSTPVPVAPTATEEMESFSAPTTEQEVPRIAPEVLKAKLDAGEDIVIVDARSLAEYETAHIDGAISIPLAEIDSRYDELPRDKEIVLYCT